jgi:hypothetical protein
MAEAEHIDFQEEIRRCATSIPFIPFDVVTIDGNRFEVHERLQMAMAGNKIVLVLPGTGITLLRKNQITALHVHETV